MKTRYILATVATAVLSLCAGGCSDNTDDSLEPVETTRTLVVDDRMEAFTINLGAAPSSVTVPLESNTRWKIEITGNDGGWCSVDRATGQGDGTFTISALENIQSARTCYVTVFMTDAEGERVSQDVPGSSLRITVSQAVSDVRLSPSSLPPFAPDGNGSTIFEITSNVAWTLDVTYEEMNPVRFITITPNSGTMQAAGDGTFSGDGAATFFMSVADNRTAADRKAFINLRSEVATYTVEVSQQKSSYTFDVSPSEPRLVDTVGGTVDFGVLSLSDWTVSTAADWITFSRTSGEASESRVSTIATVAPNTTGFERSAEIRFIPKNQSFTGLSVTVTQFGSREAAISEPWLGDGFGQTTATVMFNYYSPFVAVTEAGLQWRAEDSQTWNESKGSVSDPLAGTVSVELTSLVPATRYVARGYVIDAGGNIKYGSVGYPFTTAGRYPGSGDNPTPSN